jgi:hypothetical protein
VATGTSRCSWRKASPGTRPSRSTSRCCRRSDPCSASRAPWTDDEWAATLASLRADGWLTDDEELALTPEGARRRQAIEDRTNELALPAYAPIGQEGVDRVIELGEPIGETMAKADLTMTLPRN